MKRILLCVILSLTMYGCSGNQTIHEAYMDMGDPAIDVSAEHTSAPEPSTDKTEDTSENEKSEEIDYQAIRPNEIGQIMIIMYHGVEHEVTTPYQRSVEDFKQDLRDLYDGGFRLITIDALINNRIDVAAGFSPVIITFDDGLSSSFSLVEENGVLKPSPDCAADIINRFCEENPDFGKGAVFFINGRPKPFQGDGTLAERFKYLIDNGYELGNHSWFHERLSQLTADEIQEALAKTEALVAEHLPDHPMPALAYPYGERPKAELREYALNGSFEGQSYSYVLAIREGQSGASAAPNHIAFDPLNIPRTRGTNNSVTDFGWQLEYFKEYPEKRYISDGNPNRIAVPSEYKDIVNLDSLGDKELYLYD